MGIFPSYLFLSLSIHVLRLSSLVVTYRESFAALSRRYSSIIRDLGLFFTHRPVSPNVATSSITMSASGDSAGESVSHMTNHIPATDYATTYQSRLVDPGNGIVTEDDLALLSHLNCSYFSSGGQPPTLLALKRHAQSLATLISKLSTARTFAFIKTGSKPSKEGPELPAMLTTMPYDAFDWLHDISKPYDTTDEWHHVPLTALSNMVREESEKHGVSYHCPLHKVQLKRNVLNEEGAETTPRFLWQTHNTLLQHANECLEILDSEYTDTGGILSLLPVDKKQQQPTRNDAQSQQLQAARNTIIGQWIVHHQQLVSRMHELEINYANAIDMLEMDAVVPTELLSDAGTFIRANGQVPAFPQDRYILAGIDEDLDNKIHSILDDEESLETADDAQRREAGVVGDRMWRGEDADGYERGLVRVDLTSRFYRIKGARKSPIVIMPIAFMHPRTEATREAEARKTVVAIPQGRLPPWGGDEPVGEGAEGQSDELARLREEKKSLVHENKQLQTVIDILQRDIKTQRERFEREEQEQAAFDLQQVREAERKKEVRRKRKSEREEAEALRQQAALEAEEREREAWEQEARQTREREAREARKKQRTKGGRHVLKPPRQKE
jgi:hypothetical protein